MKTTILKHSFIGVILISICAIGCGRHKKKKGDQVTEAQVKGTIKTYMEKVCKAYDSILTDNSGLQNTQSYTKLKKISDSKNSIDLTVDIAYKLFIGDHKEINEKVIKQVKAEKELNTQLLEDCKKESYNIKDEDKKSIMDAVDAYIKWFEDNKDKEIVDE